MSKETSCARTEPSTTAHKATTSVGVNRGHVDKKVNTGTSTIERSTNERNASNTNNITPTLMEPCTSAQAKKEQPINLSESAPSAIPYASQENILILELIHFINGVHGNLIKPVKKLTLSDGITEFIEEEFKVSESIFISLREDAEQLLPMAKNFALVKMFVFGSIAADRSQVIQAMGEKFNEFIMDFNMLLVHLEEEWKKPDMTMTKLKVFLRPSVLKMNLLGNFVKEIFSKKYRGGDMLSFIQEAINQSVGNKMACDLYISIMQSAYQPFMLILEKWLENGVLYDPDRDFFIRDLEAMDKPLPKRNAYYYWESRFVIYHKNVPCFLEDVAAKILKIGKYWNLIRECDVPVSKTEKLKLKYKNIESGEMKKEVQKVFRISTYKLLKILFRDYRFLDHMTSLKGFLLMQQGDFITHFLDAAEKQLSKNIDVIKKYKIDRYLGYSVEMVARKHNLFIESVYSEFSKEHLLSYLSSFVNEVTEFNEVIDLCGFSYFTLTYEASWPIDLLLHPVVLKKYQLIFRLILYCKNIERQLHKLWFIKKIVKQNSIMDGESSRVAYALRQRMIQMIENLQNYITGDVIEHNWHILMKKLKTIDDYDEMQSIHQRFLDNCLKNCLLVDTTKHLHYLFKVGNVCLEFCNYVTAITAKDAETVKINDFLERVKFLDLKFSKTLLEFMKGLSESLGKSSDFVYNLIKRLNYNGFYTNSLSKPTTSDEQPTETEMTDSFFVVGLNDLYSSFVEDYKGDSNTSSEDNDENNLNSSTEC